MTTIIPLKIQADGKEVVVDVFADDTVNAVQEKVSAGFKQSHLPYIYANGSIGMTHRFLDSTASYDPKDWDKSSDKEPKVSSLGDVLISDWLYDTGIKKSQQLYAIFNSKWPILHPKVSSKNSDAQTNILTALQKPSSVESLSLEYYRVHYEFKVPTEKLQLASIWRQLSLSAFMPFARFCDGYGPSRAKYRLWKAHKFDRTRLLNLIQTTQGLQTTANILLWARFTHDTYASIYLLADGRIQIMFHLGWQFDPKSPPVKELFRWLWQLLKMRALPISNHKITKISLRTKLPLTMNWPSFAPSLALIPFVFRRVQTENGEGLEFMRITNYRPAMPKNVATGSKAIEPQTVLYLSNKKDGLYVEAKGDSFYNARRALEYLQVLVHISSRENDPRHTVFFGSRSIVANKKQPKQQADPGPGPVPPPGPAPAPPVVPDAPGPVGPVFAPIADEAGFDLDMLGGGYFLDRIKRYDPAINNGTQYARKCGATGNLQPVALSKEEKERIDREFPGSYDHAVYYGSDEKHKTYYICPRIWCPQSEVSMTMEQLEKNDGKCPKGEKPNRLYESNYWVKYENPHYVDFITNTETGVCLPCCYKKPPKPDTLQQCLGKDFPAASKATPGPNATNAANAEAAAPSIVRTVKKKAAVATANYVLDKPAPLEEGRLGKIPDVFQGNLPATIVRKGIKHESQEQSVLSAIANLAQLPNATALLSQVRMRLTDEAFVCMEDGQLLRQFSKNATTTAREAKMAFLSRLSSTQSSTDISLLWPICRHLLGFELLVWQKKDDSSVYLLCNGSPYDGHANLPMGMLLKDGDFYEPLYILETKGVANSALISASQYPGFHIHLKHMLSTCQGVDTDPLVGPSVTFIRALLGWAHIYTSSPEMFRVHTWVINEDGRIVACILKNHIVIARANGGFSSAAWWQSDVSRNILWPHEGFRDKTVSMSSILLQEFKEFLSQFDCYIIEGAVTSSTSVTKIKVTESDIEKIRGVKYRPLFASSSTVVIREWQKRYDAGLSEWKKEAGRIASAARILLQKNSRVHKQQMLSRFPHELGQYLVRHMFRNQDMISTQKWVDDWLEEELMETSSWYSKDIVSIQRGKVWEFTRAHPTDLPVEILDPSSADSSIRKEGDIPETKWQETNKPTSASANTTATVSWKKVPVSEVLTTKWKPMFASYDVFQPLDTRDQIGPLCDALKNHLHIELHRSMLERMTRVLIAKFVSHVQDYPRLSPDAQTMLHSFAQESLLVDPHIAALAKRDLRITQKTLTARDLWSKLLSSVTEPGPSFANLASSLVNGTMWLSDLWLFVLGQLYNINIWVIHSRKVYGKESTGDDRLDTCNLFLCPGNLENAPVLILFRSPGEDSFQYAPVVKDWKWVFHFKDLEKPLQDMLTTLRAQLQNGTRGVSVALGMKK